MKRLLALLIVMNLVLIYSAYAANPNDPADGKNDSSSGPSEKNDTNNKISEDSSLSWDAGVSFIPFTNWQFIYIYGDTRLKYDIQSRSSAYEVNFRIWPFSFGTAAVTDDNVTGKISKVMGYIGYEKFSVKISRSDLRGKGHWSGPYGYDTTPSFRLHNKITNIDLLYNGGGDSSSGLKSWYLGFTYTEFSLPLQIYTTEYAWNGGGGEPFYDENFGGKTYGLIFGFNTMKDKNKSPGWDKLVISQDRATVGKYSLSDRAIVRGEALNPGYVIGEKSATGAYVDNETALGVSWTHKFEKGGNISFALGYDLIWGCLLAYPKGTGTQPGVLAWQQVNFFFRHGVIFCINGSW